MQEYLSFLPRNTREFSHFANGITSGFVTQEVSRFFHMELRKTCEKLTVNHEKETGIWCNTSVITFSFLWTVNNERCVLYLIHA